MPLQTRWARHCNHIKDANPNGLHAAIKKYGKENFSIRMIQSCDTKEELDEKEKYWISFYNTFYGEGYNLTLGGEGRAELNISNEEIIRRYQSGESITTISKIMNCSDNTILNRLKANGVQIRDRKGIYTEQQKKNLEKGRIGGRAENFKDHVEKLKKKIIQLNANREVISEYSSLSDACRALGKPTNHTNRLREAAENNKFYWGYY